MLNCDQIHVKGCMSEKVLRLLHCVSCLTGTWSNTSPPRRPLDLILVWIPANSDSNYIPLLFCPADVIEDWGVGESSSWREALAVVRRGDGADSSREQHAGGRCGVWADIQDGWVTPLCLCVAFIQLFIPVLCLCCLIKITMKMARISFCVLFFLFDDFIFAF